MVLAAPLWVMLDTCSPNLGTFEFSSQTLVNFKAKVHHCAFRSRYNYWRLVVWNLALWFCVDADKVEVLPDLLHELIEVPLILGADGDIVREAVEQIKLLNRYSIDLIKDINAWDVDAISFDHINQVIHSVVLLENYVTV